MLWYRWITRAQSLMQGNGLPPPALSILGFCKTKADMDSCTVISKSKSLCQRLLCFHSETENPWFSPTALDGILRFQITGWCMIPTVCFLVFVDYLQLGIRFKSLNGWDEMPSRKTFCPPFSTTRPDYHLSCIFCRWSYHINKMTRRKSRVSLFVDTFVLIINWFLKSLEWRYYFWWWQSTHPRSTSGRELDFMVRTTTYDTFLCVCLWLGKDWQSLCSWVRSVFCVYLGHQNFYFMSLESKFYHWGYFRFLYIMRDLFPLFRITLSLQHIWRAMLCDANHLSGTFLPNFEQYSIVCTYFALGRSQT